MRMARMESAVRRKRTGVRLVLAAGVLMAWSGMIWMAAAQTGGQAPVDLANPLVGTAPLDKQSLIGNAPPPGEPVYSGQTSPGARLPQSSVEAAPVNSNIDLSFPNGVPTPYYYTNPTMLGFTGGGGATYGGDAEPMISPVVGEWSMPPAYRESFYDKARETAAPGYYSVYLDTFQTRVELTATRWVSLMRFTFPQSDRANVLLNFPRHGGRMEMVGDHTIRGVSQDSKAIDGAYLLRSFQPRFESMGPFGKRLGRTGDGVLGTRMSSQEQKKFPAVMRART